MQKRIVWKHRFKTVDRKGNCCCVSCGCWWCCCCRNV